VSHRMCGAHVMRLEWFKKMNWCNLLL